MFRIFILTDTLLKIPNEVFDMDIEKRIRRSDEEYTYYIKTDNKDHEKRIKELGLDCVVEPV